MRSLTENSTDLEKIEQTLLLGPIQIIVRTDELELGRCYWNVMNLVSRKGGDLVLGWKILIWPTALAVAVHHGVWRDPATGDLIDVTKSIPDDTESHTAFVADESLKVDLTRPPFIPSKYVSISEDTLVTEWIEADKDQAEAAGEFADHMFSLGATWKPISGYSLSQESAHLIDFHRKNQANKMLESVSKRMAERFSSQFPGT